MTTVANAALFVVNAYHAHKDGDERAFLDKKALPLPKDWALFKVEDKTTEGGDYAAIFVNDVTKEVFIAGRGTETWADTKAYPRIIVGIAPKERIESAERILSDLRERFHDYHIQAGGHSLDGLVWAKVSARDQLYANDLDKAPLSVLVLNAPNTKLRQEDINGYTRVVAIVENLDGVGHYGPDYTNVIKLDAAFGFLNQFGERGTHSARNLLMYGIAENGYLLDQELSQIDPIAVIGGGVAAITWQGQEFIKSDIQVHSQIDADGAIHATKIDNMGNKQVYDGLIGNKYPTHTERIYTKADGMTYTASTFFDDKGHIISVDNKKYLQPTLRHIEPLGFADYGMPEVGVTKAFEIDNSRAPRIHVAPHSKAQTQVESETAAVDMVQAGYIVQTASYSVQYDAALLFDTGFTATQQASLASGGVRPGAMQLDPNPKPNDFLDKHLQLSSHAAIFGTEQPSLLLNAAAVGSLASGSTQQVYIDPILLDLTGQGVHMTDYINSGVLFDIDHSGTLRRTGWADRKTGMLVDEQGKGKVKDISQLFSEYYQSPPGQNGLAAKKRFTDSYEALRSVDTNKNALIDPQDTIWPHLRVWVDANHNGQSETGELTSLDGLGISQISLANKPAQPDEMRDGNRVRAYGSFIMKGKEHEAMSVDFIADPTGTTVSPLGQGNILTSQAASKIRASFGAHNVNFSVPAAIKTYTSHSEQGERLEADTLGVNHLYGGVGNDTLIASRQGSWLVGGGGSNIYQGGPGDDVLIISATDELANIHGGDGTNTAIIIGKGNVLLNLQAAQIHIAQGGPGNNILISGGATAVYIKGGSGTNTLVGGAGDDVLVGGSGHNFIIGGTGKSIIYAGPNGDVIYGADKDSIIHAGGGDDDIIAGPGNDVIEVGCGNAQIDGGGGINIVQFHGSYGDYHIEKTAKAYVVTDKMPQRDGRVTLLNVHKFAFSDISIVDLTLASPAPVADSLRVNQSGQLFDRLQAHRIAAAQLLDNDQLLNSQAPLRITNVSEAVGGQVMLTPAGDVLFTPDPQFMGIMQFKYAIADAAGSVSQVENKGETASMRAVVSLLTPEMPKDPLMAQQWYLNDANIFPVWPDYTGKGVRIGQFEPSGEFAVGPEILDYQHPDLKANIDPVWLAAQKAKGTLPTAFSTHATLVAGIMVAAKNGAGIVGVAPEATIIGYALDRRGADVTALGHMTNTDIVNHSWGLSSAFTEDNRMQGEVTLGNILLSTVQYAASNGRGGLGSVIVCASGNKRAQGGSAQDSLMSNNRFSIQVGAINAAGDLSTLQIKQAAFSNPGASILISAPGSNIVSTSQMVMADHGSVLGQAIAAAEGTSFATPIVSGIVALMLEANPHLGYRDVQHILSLSARQVQDAHTVWSDNHARYWNGGAMHISHDYGFGAVDARAAVRLAETWLARNTAANEFVFSEKVAEAASLQDGKIVSAIMIPAGLQIEHIEIDLDLTYSDLSDLVVKLISPTHTSSLLLNRYGINPANMTQGIQADVFNVKPGALKYRFMTTHNWGEVSQGNWSLELINVKSNATTLQSWALHLYGSKLSVDDTYFYTDEYAELVKVKAQRAFLDDAINGSAGGRNTIHAAAVKGRVNVNLLTGEAYINGQGLTIHHPHEIHNIISGDGDDVLVANHAGAVLDGGRGRNTLTGGQGEDVFIIHRRANGQDKLINFDMSRGDKIHLVGFAGIQQETLLLKAEGADVQVQLQEGQHIILQNQAANLVNLKQAFIIQDTLNLPRAYLDSSSETKIIPDESGVVLLSGGADGVSLSAGMRWKLAGKVYDRIHAKANTFSVMRKNEEDNDAASARHYITQVDYHNVVRGFKPGTDHIDLCKLGIQSSDDLMIERAELGVINDIAAIQGSNILSRSLGNEKGHAKLVYLDAIDPAQISKSDFIFAGAKGPKPVEFLAATDWEKHIQASVSEWTNDRDGQKNTLLDHIEATPANPLTKEISLSAQQAKKQKHAEWACHIEASTDQLIQFVATDSADNFGVFFPGDEYEASSHLYAATGDARLQAAENAQ